MLEFFLYSFVSLGALVLRYGLASYLNDDMRWALGVEANSFPVCAASVTEAAKLQCLGIK